MIPGASYYTHFGNKIEIYDQYGNIIRQMPSCGFNFSIYESMLDPTAKQLRPTIVRNASEIKRGRCVYFENAANDVLKSYRYDGSASNLCEFLKENEHRHMYPIDHEWIVNNNVAFVTGWD